MVNSSSTRVSTGFLNSSLLASKLVSMERASLKESSATKNIKNKGWMRWKSAVESHGCEGERQYRTLISLLGSLATMRRVVNYHSSWARQRQVELFDASCIGVLFHGEWLITTLWFLTSNPKTYAEAVDSAIDIEEGLWSRRARRQQAPQGGRPAIQGAQSSYSSQSAYQPQQQQQQPQVAQQSGRQRFRPRGQQFKKKSGSGSSGSGSSSSSGSRVEFCGFCGGKHPSTQCVGVQGSCNLCGQYGHFARVLYPVVGV
ncbi:hypothetical protein F511_39496 [Dorcoceras hygrometricum]|uniref:Uncharacterized protein n=1 Tax=Dorcoceras hygrometricum TaxID=472368 RepID=A0A2Z7AJ84_9LAMI|nr:hypothetical protein F511_39496 [Dorcoceras hygrometricum]